jgi:hypothetical protein
MQIRFSFSVEALAATRRTAVALNSESKRSASTSSTPFRVVAGPALDQISELKRRGRPSGLPGGPLFSLVP